jgi:hypothetical protein
MRAKDEKPMMSPLENWQWLVRETTPYSQGRTHCTDLARSALCEWSLFLGRRTNRVR